MMREKTERNLEIYRLVKFGIPQTTIANHYGIKRQAVNAPYLRYAKQYGPADKLTEKFSPVIITQKMSDMLKAETKRLPGTSKSNIVRIAINQANAALPSFPKSESLELRKEDLTHKISINSITLKQKEFIDKMCQGCGIKKSQVLRLVLENYEPFQF